jgi:hypothetical protein
VQYSTVIRREIMKKNTVYIIVLLFFSLFILPSCIKGNYDSSSQSTSISQTDKNNAKIAYDTCKDIADSWLTELDKNGYSYIRTIKYYELTKKALPEIEITRFSSKNEKIYGKAKKRSFLGAHSLIDNKFISWLPNYDEKMFNRIHQEESKDGFYIVAPKYFGLNKSSDMLRNFPKGNYVLLMYTTKPTKKAYAEEIIVLWEDNTKNWQVVSYKIADEV